MLINIDPILSPDILKTMREMGHGDRLVIADINFPAHSNHDRVHRLDGLDMATVMRAVLSVFPLDSFIAEPIQRMEIDGKPDEINEVHQDLIDTVCKVSGPNWKVGSIERQQFYVEAKETFAVITTSDTRPYGCFIFTKGVLKPDGTIWVL